MKPDLDRPFAVRFLRAFVYAARGVARASRHRNFRCQVIAGVVAIALAAWLDVSPVEWAILALTIAGVLALETMNTAIEDVVDLVSPARHPLAGAAKDASAGAVLIVSLGAIGVGWAILGTRLIERL